MSKLLLNFSKVFGDTSLGFLQNVYDVLFQILGTKEDLRLYILNIDRREHWEEMNDDGKNPDSGVVTGRKDTFETIEDDDSYVRRGCNIITNISQNGDLNYDLSVFFSFYFQEMDRRDFPENESGQDFATLINYGMGRLRKDIKTSLEEVFGVENIVDDKFIISPTKVKLSVTAHEDNYTINIECDFSVMDEPQFRPGGSKYNEVKESFTKRQKKQNPKQ